MNGIRLMFLAVAVTCLCSAAFADITFANEKGTITSKASGTTGYYLQSSGSQLNSLSGTGALGLDCSGLASQGGTCSGIVSYTSGLTSGFDAALIDNVTGGPTTLGAGGMLKITEGGMTVFTGTFTNDTWTYVGTCTGTTTCGVTNGYWAWELQGNVSGTLSNGVAANGVLIQLTTQHLATDPFIHGTGTSGIAGGSGSLQPVVPETGTLVLFGTGLVGIALLARRKEFGSQS